MGRNKIKIEKIKNERIRQVTFYKRKKGLLKKAMELSLLCDAKVFLGIVDKNEKLTVFSSERNPCAFIESYLAIPIKAREIYTHDDYKTVFVDSEKEISSENRNSKTDSDKDKDKSYTKKEVSKIGTSSGKNSKINKRQTVQRAKIIKVPQEDEVACRNESISSSCRSEMTNNNSRGISKIKNKLSLKVIIPELSKQNVGNSESKDMNIINNNIEENEISSSHITANSACNNNIAHSSEVLKELKLIIDKKNVPALLKSNLIVKKESNPEGKFLEPNDVNKTPGKTPTQGNMGSSPNRCYSRNYTMTSINPLSCQKIDSLHHKRVREENLISFSPNLSAGGSLRQLTPLCNVPPTYFMFKPNNQNGNSFTPTPMNQGGSQAESFDYSSMQTYSNDKNVNEDSIDNKKEECKEDKQSFIFSEISERKSEDDGHSNKGEDNTELNKNNSSSSNNKHSTEGQNLLTPNNSQNMGFYAWVMKEPSPKKISTPESTGRNKASRSNHKLRKTKYKNEDN